MLCIICIEDIPQGDDIKCTKCNEFLHFNCAGLREASFKKMSVALKKLWTCSNCKTKKLVMTPVTAGKSQTVTDETLKSVVESVNFMSSQFDDFNNQLKHLLSTINENKCENKRIAEENLLLKKETENLSERLNKIEQKTLERQIEIVGVPESKNEICTKTIQTIINKLGSDVTAQKAFRLISNFSNKPRILSVCFNTLNDKSQVMELAKKHKLVAKDLDPTWNESAVYFNEKMTYTYRNLFFKARTSAKQVGYKYIWFKNNTIFDKKNDISKSIIIDDELSISRMV